MKVLKMKNFLFTTVLITLLTIAGPAAAQCGFDDWDGDETDLIENEEFDDALTDAGYYDSWDLDEDGILTEDEWDSGVEVFWGDYDDDVYGEFSDWDVNDDNELSEDEFDNGFFDAVDDDESDTIDKDEWDLFEGA